MSVTVPTWIVALLIFVAFIALCLWVDRRFLRPWADSLAAKLVAWHHRRTATREQDR